MQTKDNQLNVGTTLEAPQPSQRKSRHWLWIVIALAALGCLAVCAVIVLPTASLVNQISTGASAVDGPIQTSKNFYNSMIHHDYSQAYADLAVTMTSKISQQDLQAKWALLESATSDLAVENVSAYIAIGDNNNSHAVVALSTVGTNQQYVVRLTLNKSDKGWEITDAQPALIPNPK